MLVLKESYRDSWAAPTPPRFAKPGALDCANEDSFADELSLAQARRDELLSLVSSTKALGGAWQQSVSSAKPKKLVGSV
jgi:hypothetical protein